MSCHHVLVVVSRRRHRLARLVIAVSDLSHLVRWVAGIPCVTV